MLYDRLLREITTVRRQIIKFCDPGAAARQSSDSQKAPKNLAIDPYISNLPVGVFYVDDKDILLTFNLALANILNVSQNALVGKSYQQLFATMIENTDQPDMVQIRLNNALLNINSQPSVEIKLIQNEAKYFRLKLFSTYSAAGTPSGWGGTLEDITTLRKEGARKLELLSAFSRSIRSSIASLKGRVHALDENYRQWDEEMVDEFLLEIREGIDRVSRTLDQSMAVTRLENDELNLHPEETEVQELISQVQNIVSEYKENKEVKLEIAEDLPFVNVDPGYAGEVLAWVMVWMVKSFPSRGDISLQVREGHDRVEFLFTKEREVLSSDELAHLFDKRNISKKDLGFYVSQKIMRALGGDLSIQSPISGMQDGILVKISIPVFSYVAGEMGDETQPVLEEEHHSRTVLIAEKEPEYQALLRSLLKDIGFSIELVTDGRSAIDILESSQVDLVLISHELEDMTGVTLCRNIRRFLDVPVIMFGAANETDHSGLISGIEAGADDYMIKPIHSDALNARITAVLRRRNWLNEEGKTLDVYSTKKLRVDFKTRQVWVDGIEVSLTSTEFDLLGYLVQHPDQVLTYAQINEAVWSPGGGGRHALSVHVSRLRQKIEDDPQSPKMLLTKWGVGYMFKPVSE